LAGGRVVKPAARALFVKLLSKPTGLFVRGAEVRAARELVGLEFATLEDNGEMKIDGRADGERWFVALTLAELAGERHAYAQPTILVTRRTDDYHAAIEGTDGKRWGRGKTPTEAIGDLLSAHADALGIKIVFPPPEAPC